MHNYDDVNDWVNNCNTIESLIEFFVKKLNTLVVGRAITSISTSVEQDITIVQNIALLNKEAASLMMGAFLGATSGDLDSALEAYDRVKASERDYLIKKYSKIDPKAKFKELYEAAQRYDDEYKKRKLEKSELN